ncbi:hypothetical protein ATERTT37_005999 [Aspergillus terreus]
MSGEIDALYIYDEHNNPLVEQVYRSRPPSAAAILPLYLAHPAPRPSLLYLPGALPPVTVFSVVQSNLLFLALSEVDTDPLLVLEFLHRVVDVLEEFIGAPLLSTKLQANYDVVAQLLNEMCDGGIVCNTEQNALQEVVEMPGWMGKLLGASGTIAFTAKMSGIPDLLLSLTTPGGQQAIARKIELPVFHPCVRLAKWRERPGELSFIPPDGRFILAGYEVDLLPMDPALDQPPTHMEKLFLPAIVDLRKSLGPTGSEFEVRLILNTNFPGHSAFPRPGAGRGGSGTSTPSFLAGGSGGNTSAPILEEVVVSVPIPKSVRSITDMQASRGEALVSPGSDVLEWRVPTKDAGTVSGTATLRCTVTGYPTDEDLDEEVEDLDAEPDINLLQGYYDASTSYQNTGEPDTTTRKTKKKKKKKVKKSSKSKDSDQQPPQEQRPRSSPDQSESHTPTAQPPPPSSTPPVDPTPSQPPADPSPSSPFSIFHAAPRKTKTQLNASLMPNSAAVSFSVKGWLPSGIKVDSLNVDTRRSRGLGEGVKPYKGVKYLCISRKGVERRC